VEDCRPSVLSSLNRPGSDASGPFCSQDYPKEKDREGACHGGDGDFRFAELRPGFADTLGAVGISLAGRDVG